MIILRYFVPTSFSMLRNHAGSFLKRNLFGALLSLYIVSLIQNDYTVLTIFPFGFMIGACTAQLLENRFFAEEDDFDEF